MQGYFRDEYNHRMGYTRAFMLCSIGANAIKTHRFRKTVYVFYIMCGVGKNVFRRNSDEKNLVRFSIGLKLLLIYLLCVLAPIVIFSTAIYTSVMQSTKNEKMILYRQALNRIGAEIEANVISAIELANIIYPDTGMYAYLNKEYTDSRECLEDFENYLRDAWDRTLPYNTKVAVFSVYTSNNTLLSSNHLQCIDNIVFNSDWYTNYRTTFGKGHFVKHFDEVMFSTARRKLVSYFRKLDYIPSKKYQHFLKITFQADMFYKILKSENIPGNVYLVDKDNYIIAQSNPEEESYSNTEFIPLKMEGYGKNVMILKEQIQAMDGWRAICILDKDFMSDDFRASIINVVSLILVVTIFSTIIIWAISASLYRRINILVKHISKVEKGEYTLISEKNKGNDEIGLLITSTNKMIAKIDVLIEDVYKAKIRETQLELSKKQSELNALQCQVNPHFMFNVLETIRIKSFLKNEFETARIIKYMSKLFRKLLVWNEDLIELQEELNFIKEYLEVQQYRYEDELEFEITADERVLGLKIPKMTLQTFVDNACEHGFSESKELKKIKIDIRLLDDKVEMRVYDNGKGMKPELIDNIENLMSESIGIKNVIGRLDLYYAGNYEFKINSQLGEYTEVVLTVDLDEIRRCKYV